MSVLSDNISVQVTFNPNNVAWLLAPEYPLWQWPIGPVFGFVWAVALVPLELAKSRWTTSSSAPALVLCQRAYQN
jgi:hypothetical protein